MKLQRDWSRLGSTPLPYMAFRMLHENSLVRPGQLYVSRVYALT